jgi:glycoprotein endo-alpha-1,2-mannosidase
MVGAYYYSWNPENLSEGTLRAHLVPSQQPPDALVNNANPAVAARAITEAKQAGLSFFALDWWPLGPSPVPLSVRVKSDDNIGAFLKARNLASFKFCMFYETWNLNFDPVRETTAVTPAVEAHFDADMLLFARKFFANRSYLRIDGRPVVVLYLTRTLTGDVAGMISGARAALERVGYDPFFIGDEMYWRVTQITPPPSGSALTLTPQVARIEDFDAITAYTMYYGPPVPSLGLTQNLTGYPGRTPVVRDEKELIDQYRQATDGRVPVLPDVSPGFNDRGVRLPTNHPAQPRQWLPGEGPSSTLDHLLRDVALPEVDPRLPIVFVTAWDEWNEDTGVAPVPGTATSKDDSPTGKEYTQGYTYGGEGDSALVVLRRDIALGDRELAHKRAAT